MTTGTLLEIHSSGKTDRKPVDSRSIAYYIVCTAVYIYWCSRYLGTAVYTTKFSRSESTNLVFIPTSIRICRAAGVFISPPKIISARRRVLAAPARRRPASPTAAAHAQSCCESFRGQSSGRYYNPCTESCTGCSILDGHAWGPHPPAHTSTS
jgi:hypothetical protein